MAGIIRFSEVRAIAEAVGVEVDFMLLKKLEVIESERRKFEEEKKNESSKP